LTATTPRLSKAGSSAGRPLRGDIGSIGLVVVVVVGGWVVLVVEAVVVVMMVVVVSVAFAPEQAARTIPNAANSQKWERRMAGV